MAEVIQRQYTYKLPDTYYGTTAEEGNTASAMYEGYDYGYVYVNKETSRLCVEEGFHPEFTENRTAEELLKELKIAGGLGREVVRLSPRDNDDHLLLVAMITGQNISEWPRKEYAFPAGHPNAGEVYHDDPDPLPLNDVYNKEEIYYDFETKSFKMDEIPFIGEFCSKEQHEAARVSWINHAIEVKESGNWNADQIAALDLFIEEMEAIPTKYDGIHHMMITFPEFPNSVLYPQVEDRSGEDIPDEEAPAEG